ncbi:MAG TPA: hypothetical protein VH877_03135 [Polyangia bacterium]|jgi:hypothetical protein|nr:hypothetical protein [Polyangia bacterium]
MTPVREPMAVFQQGLDALSDRRDHASVYFPDGEDVIEANTSSGALEQVAQRLPDCILRPLHDALFRVAPHHGFKARHEHHQRPPIKLFAILPETLLDPVIGALIKTASGIRRCHSATVEQSLEGLDRVFICREDLV